MSESAYIGDLRADLAAIHRILALENLHEGTWGHLSVRLPHSGGYLFSPGDTHWSEVTASALLHYDVNGDLLSGSGSGSGSCNIDAQPIHAPVYQRRNDVVCILHFHPPYCTALSCMRGVRFSPLGGQLAGAFFGKTSFLDYFSSPRSNEEEGRIMAEALGDGTVLFMKSHGVLIATRTLNDAVMSAYTLERAARLQYLVLSAGQEIAGISEEDARFLSSEDSLGEPGYFEGMKSLLRKRYSDYLD